MMMKLRFVLVLIGLILATAAILEAKEKEEIEDKIEGIISQLTLEEKVALCHAQSKFSSPGIPRLGIPDLWYSDGPHGVRADLEWDSWSYTGQTNDSCTAFPALTCLAATFNPELSYEYGNAIGEEAKYREKDVLLGPGVNIYRTPMNGRNFEYLGEDPLLASKMVVPYIQGVQHNGVAACVKHFALNNQEKWRLTVDVDVSDRALREIYLPAYKAAVQEGKVWAVMGSYNKFRGQFCCHNEVLVKQILKDEWGFDGVMTTDWGGTHNTMEAIYNGLDIEMGTWTDGLTKSRENAYQYYFLANPFLELLQNGKVDESVLDDKVRRVLRLMFRTNMNYDAPKGRMNNPEHLQTARKIATEGIVLLKNKDKLFPINDLPQITIAVIGDNATRKMTIGGGSSELKVKHEVSPLEGIQNRYKNAKIVYTQGYTSKIFSERQEEYRRELVDSLEAEAIKVASQANVVLFIGGLNKGYFMDCEGMDRLDYALPFNQNKLIEAIQKVNPNIGVMLISGNAVETPWVDKVKGLMQVWYLGSQAGNAIADVVSGDVNPSGKLPFTFPVKLDDNGAISNGKISYPGIDEHQIYKEGILVGYRWHDTKKIKPQFAFGYGLSYTSFTLKNITTNKNEFYAGDTIIVKATIKNTGSINGAEVIQVYVGKPNSKVDRALKELKGYQKVDLKTGETNNIEIKIATNDLSYYNEEISNWTLEQGKYLIYTGNSSDNITSTLEIQIKD